MESVDMITVEKMTDEELYRHALALIRRELGFMGFVRFLRLQSSTPGDYTVDRDKWQKDLTVEGFVESMKNKRLAG